MHPTWHQWLDGVLENDNRGRGAMNHNSQSSEAPSAKLNPPGQWRNPLAVRLLIYFRRHNLTLFCRVLQLLLGSDIYGPVRHDTRMPHPYGIVIHGSAKIGRNVLIMQQVTIGAKDAGNQAPSIGDDVVLGAGSKILGGIHVGSGAVVGANAVVTKDVPACATVVGANRIIKTMDPRVSRNSD